MSARPAVANLMRESEEWRYFFRRCCETSPFRLRAQAWQWRDELRERGQTMALAELEDALADFAGELMPDSPGAAWDEEHAGELAADALNWLARHYPECSGAPALDAATEDVHAATLVGHHAEYREALRRFCEAGRDEALRIRQGAA